MILFKKLVCIIFTWKMEWQEREEEKILIFSFTPTHFFSAHKRYETAMNKIVKQTRISRLDETTSVGEQL